MKERRVKCNYCMSEYDEKYLSKDCAGEEICPVCYLSNEWRYIEYSDPVKAQMLEALKDMMNKICDRCEGLDLQDCLDCPDENFRQAIEAAEKEEV